MKFTEKECIERATFNDDDDDLIILSEEEDMESDDEESELTDIGMEYLINPDKENEKPAAASTTAKDQPQDAGPNKDITDIAAAAQSLQPTGYTLSTTQVGFMFVMQVSWKTGHRGIILMVSLLAFPE